MPSQMLTFTSVLALWLVADCFAGLLLGCTRALRAQTPIDDFGFVDHKSAIVRSHQTWDFTYCAINIRDCAAGPADDVMVVVANAGFVSGYRIAWLNPAHQTG